MKVKEISSMDDKAIYAKMDELKLELMKLNAQVNTGTAPKNPGQIKQIKKIIARMFTVLNSRNSTKK